MQSLLFQLKMVDSHFACLDATDHLSKIRILYLQRITYQRSCTTRYWAIGQEQSRTPFKIGVDCLSCFCMDWCPFLCWCFFARWCATMDEPWSSSFLRKVDGL